MKRTISAMVGKGSVNHNSRNFTAENVDPERTRFNIDYCNEPIKKVYHKLFDEALKKYNEKQKRADRRIQDYYEKISASRQEKPFHEVILQIGKFRGYELLKQKRAACKADFGRVLSRLSGAESPPVCVLGAPPHG